MVKQIVVLFRKIIVSSFLLYGFNLIASSFGLLIPINIITVLFVSILGLPGLFSLMLILILIF
ncbi:MAG: pro-sigmaK processing inhibitor BofA family protein [Bacilli bacterium]